MPRASFQGGEVCSESLDVMNDHSIPRSFEKSIGIHAPAASVWTHLTDIELMKAWMGEPEMALEIETNWVVGAPIVVRGFHHVSFKNAGRVLEFNPPGRLAYTHLSSLSRLPDEPASYVTFEFLLTSTGSATFLKLRARDFPTSSIFKHLRFYWGTTLEILKRHVEGAK